MTFLGPHRIGNFKPRKLGQKRAPKPVRDGNDSQHLERLRKLPCCICLNPAPNTVHHLKCTGQRGTGMRSPDKFGLPMCWWPHSEDCHGQVERQGSRKELAWFRKRGIEPLELAAALWGCADESAMHRVLMTHMEGGK